MPWAACRVSAKSRFLLFLPLSLSPLPGGGGDEGAGGTPRLKDNRRPPLTLALKWFPRMIEWFSQRERGVFTQFEPL